MQGEKPLEILAAIVERRSIRKFQDKEIPKELLEKVLEATSKAPSGKNIQPWRFVVLEGEKKKELTNLLSKTLMYLKENGINTGTARNTFKIMEQAPTLVFVFNTNSTDKNTSDNFGNYRWKVDVQSIGGAIQTMLLAAQDMRLGTLWICDVFYCDTQICNFLNRNDELLAAVALGYPNEKPLARPRKNLNEVAEWIS